MPVKKIQDAERLFRFGTKGEISKKKKSWKPSRNGEKEMRERREHK